MNEEDTQPQTAFTALVLAGDRRPQDPVAEATGSSCKALSPVDGTPMLLRVLDALAESEAIGAIVLSGPHKRHVGHNRRLQEGVASEQWGWREPAATPSTSAYAALQSLPDDAPVLLTTADHALLNKEVVDYFCVQASQAECDLAVAFVPHAQVISAFPGMRRTAVRFRDGAYCGCNLYAFLTPEARKVADFWRQVEQERKHPWRMIKVLGWLPLVTYLTRRLTLGETLEMLSSRLGLSIRPVLLPFPAAAVDVDKPADLEYVEWILDRRKSSDTE